jgi:hypothetical protein
MKARIPGGREKIQGISPIHPFFGKICLEQGMNSAFEPEQGIWRETDQLAPTSPIASQRIIK